MHIFRHLAHKFFDIRQYACKISAQSAEKSVCVSAPQSLCGVALSYKEAARQFDVSFDTVVAKWERIYLEEGKEGFYVERRGRKSTGRPPKLKKEVEEDLIAEVQRLRAENAYLKKLNALVAERVRQEKKHK